MQTKLIIDGQIRTVQFVPESKEERAVLDLLNTAAKVEVKHRWARDGGSPTEIQFDDNPNWERLPEIRRFIESKFPEIFNPSPEKSARLVQGPDGADCIFMAAPNTTTEQVVLKLLEHLRVLVEKRRVKARKAEAKATAKAAKATAKAHRQAAKQTLK